MLFSDNGLDSRSAPGKGAIRVASAEILEARDIAALLGVKNADSREVAPCSITSL